MKKTIMGAMVALTMFSGQALAAGDAAAGQAKSG
ncbi:cytochrome c, partial [Vibrio parahaemolyticus]|nr:cytochrome c [Vibrio parahaemolyticus]